MVKSKIETFSSCISRSEICSCSMKDCNFLPQSCRYTQFNFLRSGKTYNWQHSNIGLNWILTLIILYTVVTTRREFASISLMENAMKSTRRPRTHLHVTVTFCKAAATTMCSAPAATESISNSARATGISLRHTAITRASTSVGTTPTTTATTSTSTAVDTPSTISATPG